MNVWTFTLWSFSAVVVGHLGLRMYRVVHRARLKPRGDIRQPAIFRQMIISYGAIFLASVLEYRSGFWTHHALVSGAGVCLYGLSSWLQWRALADLGAAYSPDIEVRSEQPLVRNGLYAWVRHPLLTGGTLETLSIPLVFNAYASLLLVLAIFVPVIRHRWREEEKVLLEHFGDAYRAYCRDVGAFIPRSMRAGS